MSPNYNLCTPVLLSHGGDEDSLALVNVGRGVAGLPPLESTANVEIYTTKESCELIGALALGKGTDGRTFLLGIGIEEEHRQNGHGTKLLQRALKDNATQKGANFGVAIETPKKKLPGWVIAFLRNGVTISEPQVPYLPPNMEI